MTGWGQLRDRTFKTIKNMGLTAHDDLESFVVVIATLLTLSHVCSAFLNVIKRVHHIFDFCTRSLDSLNSLTTQDQYVAHRITEVMYGLSQAGDIDPGQVLLKNSSFNHFSATRWYSDSLR